MLDIREDKLHLSEELKCYPTFASMGIRTELLKGIYKLGKYSALFLNLQALNVLH